MYCGLFGDGQVFKTTFNDDGSVKQTVRIINIPAFECADGMIYDKNRNRIFMTDSRMNAVWIYDIAGKVFQRLWQNNDNDGSTGLLDQPCEPLVYINKLYVVNFDMIFPMLMNRKSDEKVNTIRVFDLSKLDF